MALNENNLVWIDLEMTGLEPDVDVILEMATIVTDSNLNVLAEGPTFAIKTPDEVLDTMSAWCIEQHGKSGLTQRCRDSQTDLDAAVEQTIAFLSQYVPAGNGKTRRFPLAGCGSENHYSTGTQTCICYRWRLLR